MSVSFSKAFVAVVGVRERSVSMRTLAREAYFRTTLWMSASVNSW